VPAPSHIQLNYQKTRGCGLAIGLLFAISIAVFVGGIFAIVVVSLKGSGAYEEALSFVAKHPEVVRDLGKPIEDGFMPLGEISTSGAYGSANLTISLSGPRGDGDADVSLVKAAGKWTITSATWRHDGSTTTLEP
jgi:hypothetical protein